MEDLASPWLAQVGQWLVMSSVALKGVTVNDPWWVYLLGSGGGLAILTLIIKELMSALKGRGEATQTRNAGLVLQRDTAWRERDDATSRANCEARNARKALNYAAVLRRQLINHGVPDEKIPLEPSLENCDLD